MKIKTWNPAMTEKETADLAYWERNVLALYFAGGWYYDDIGVNWTEGNMEAAAAMGYGLVTIKPRFQGWRRVLSIDNGRFTFHIPDDFDVGNLKQIEPNWDGHTTEEKWRRMLDTRDVPA